MIVRILSPLALIMFGMALGWYSAEIRYQYAHLLVLEKATTIANLAKRQARSLKRCLGVDDE